MGFSTLAGRDTTNHMGTIINSLLAVESSLLACETLANDAS